MDYRIPEDVGIKSVREFYGTLKGLLEGDETVILDFSGLMSVHLSVSVVVMAAHREAKRLGKAIKLKNVSEPVRRQLYLTGFNI
ncbi:MAG: STAS domain-containing protein [Spirochaetes bacterium]|nr:STAS domain-containing protein [Spirochaetota bacterium]